MTEEKSFSIYSEFAKPALVETAKVSDNCMRFVAQPMEKGYAVTLGNSLRRVLLSSIRGVCVSSIKIEGVKHEFSAIKGVAEDAMAVALNFKDVAVLMDSIDSISFSTTFKGPGVMTAGQLALPSGVRVVNPDLYLFTISDNADVTIVTNLQAGFGMELYNEKSDQEPGLINLNRNYSPVRNVLISTESCTYGNKTDYEKLLIEVETNGTISPNEAMSMAASILKEMVNLFVEIDDSKLISSINSTRGNLSFQQASSNQNIGSDMKMLQPTDKLVSYVEFSVRTTNCLKKMGIVSLSDLAQKSQLQLLSMKNFGKKSLNEVIQKLHEHGFKLADE